jgi:hypothetical protein
MAVLQDGVDALVMLATAAVRKAGLDWRELPVAIGGGVLQGSPAIQELLAERLRTVGSLPARTIAPRAAAHGAAWLAHGFFHRQEPQCSWVNRVAI